VGHKRRWFNHVSGGSSCHHQEPRKLKSSPSSGHAPAAVVADAKHGPRYRVGNGDQTTPHAPARIRRNFARTQTNFANRLPDRPPANGATNAAARLHGQTSVRAPACRESCLKDFAATCFSQRVLPHDATLLPFPAGLALLVRSFRRSVRFPKILRLRLPPILVAPAHMLPILGLRSRYCAEVTFDGVVR